MATFISATSCFSAAGRSHSTPSSSVRWSHPVTCSTISASCSWIWSSAVSNTRPTSSSTAILPRPGGPRISTRSQACRSFFRCAPPPGTRGGGARPHQPPPDAPAAIKRGARAYFDFARRFIAPSAPRLVAVGGLSGTGKSALACALAPQLAPAPGAVMLRSDVERKMLFGKDEHEKLPEDAYSPAVTARVYATIADKARPALASGHSAVVDAVFARPQERAVVAAAPPILGVPFHGLFLVADLDTRVAPLGARRRDPSDAPAAVARRQKAYDVGALDWMRIDASDSPEETFARARTAMGQ